MALNIMYQSESIAIPLGKAWANHRNGKNETAVSEFDRILKDSPNDIDANFGLGLAQRSLGWYDQAVAQFQKAKDLIARAVETKPDDADRWAMLARMCDQRIAEVATLKETRPPVP